VLSLSKVVCNLRHYYGMNPDQAVFLVTNLYNPKSDDVWSEESIRLTWELVAEYAPGLGVEDPAAKAMQRRLDLETDVAELLAYTRPGGRVRTDDFYALLLEWNPDMEVTKTLLTQVVTEITGVGTSCYRDGRSYKGFHLPTQKELEDPTHSVGINADLVVAPHRPLKKLVGFDGFPDYSTFVGCMQAHVTVYQSKFHERARAKDARRIQRNSCITFIPKEVFLAALLKAI
jgi:hypothetical protein